ncbi:RepB family DNA primase [Paraburkholderia sp. CNPSo 3274]|uniref:DNA-primase RepB domain-containing protein n=1 Tax=Paraburkholderia sp. CNPSo 3274 TaxID=2940932 RepID=UPI0020B7D1A7|nr:RepB family DNA primase [Paraburkholderia sp. CNPSo 3274]
MPRREGLTGKNFARHVDHLYHEGQPERFYTADEVAARLSALARENMRGFDIYVTPKSATRHYVLVDDMCHDGRERLLDAGYQPRLVQQSSVDNYQAVLTVSKARGVDDEQDRARVREAVGKPINSQVGDPKMSTGGVGQAFRMAGFSNKKPGRDNSITRVLSTARVDCAMATERADKAARVDQQAREAVADRQVMAQVEVVLATPAPTIGSRAAQVATRIYRRVLELAKSLVDAGTYAKLSLTKVDYQAARGMLIAGLTEVETRDGLKANSLAIQSGKYKDPERELGRTVQHALEDSKVQRAIKDRQTTPATRPSRAVDTGRER